MTFLETVGHSILPSAMSHADEKTEREFAAKLSAEAYMKLHEIALKGNSYTNDCKKPNLEVGKIVLKCVTFFIYNACFIQLI